MCAVPSDCLLPSCIHFLIGSRLLGNYTVQGKYGRSGGAQRSSRALFKHPVVVVSKESPLFDKNLLLLCFALLTAVPIFAQEGLRLVEMDAYGIP